MSRFQERPLIWGVIVWLLLVFQTDAAEIYRWRDSGGTLHFSDSPPPHFSTDPSDPGKSGIDPSPLENESAPGLTISTSSPAKSSFFWKIEKRESKPSHILGTIHVEDDRVIALKPSIAKVLQDADLLALEITMEDINVFKAASAMIFLNGQDLEAILGTELFNRTTRSMQTYLIPEMALRKMKPWAVMSLLTTPKPKSGRFLDRVLYQEAMKQGKTVQGLETVDEQLEALEGIPISDQVALLRQALDHQEAIPEILERMITAYTDGDLTKLMELSDQVIGEGNSDLQKRFMFRLNDARNMRMVQRMHPYLLKGNAFIAVGALHLPGDAGILNLLRKKGYAVTPIIEQISN